MTKVDHKELCKELSGCGHVVVLEANDQCGRPWFGVAKVLNHCQVPMAGRVYWGLVCVEPGTEEVKWYPYNDIMGYLKDGKAHLDGVERCLRTRYRWMDRQETMDTYEVVQLMVEDMRP